MFLKSRISIYLFFLSALLVCAQAQAAVTPGQEQESFANQSVSSNTDETIKKESSKVQIGFAASARQAQTMMDEDDDERSSVGRRTSDDDDEADYTASTSRGYSEDNRKIVLPIQGRIDVKTLRALAEALKNIDDDEGQVEVNLSIEISKIPGVFENTYSSADPLAATYAFEKGAPSKSPEQMAEQKDLKRANKAAQNASIQELTTELPFFVQKIDIVGNTIISTAELNSLVSGYQGKQLKLSEAKQAADAITQLYRQKGFITCRAYIPPQQLETKTLVIKVMEGTLGKVKIRGNKFYKKRVLKRYLAHLRGKVLQYQELEKALQKVNLHPDRNVKAILVPGEDIGTSDLLLEVKDSMPVHISAEVNNFGTELTGHERYGVGFRHNNLLGQDDILSTRLQLGEEVLSVAAQHVLPIGPYGTQAGWSFAYSDVNVGGQFSALDIGGQAYTASVFAMHPLYDGDKVDLTWTGSFESKTIDNTLLGQSSSKDELRMLHTGANLDIVDRFGRTFIINDFTFGLDALGASEKNDPRLSRLNSGADFFIYNGALTRIHPVYNQTYLYLKGAVQSGPDPLVSAEQFDLGGVYSVRGYPQSDYLGDYGTSGTAEIRIPWYFIPSDIKAPYSDEPLWNKINFVGFVDAGYAALKRPAVGEAPSRSYVGAGAGVRIDLPHNFQARFEWAAPVGDDPTDGSNGQFYFSVSSDLI